MKDKDPNKKALSPIQWDEEETKVRDMLMEIYNPKSSLNILNKLENMVAKIMQDRYILDKRIDTFERVEGLSNSSQLNLFRNSLGTLYNEWKKEGFDIDEIKVFMDVELDEIENQYENDSTSQLAKDIMNPESGDSK